MLLRVSQSGYMLLEFLLGLSLLTLSLHAGLQSSSVLTGIHSQLAVKERLRISERNAIAKTKSALIGQSYPSLYHSTFGEKRQSIDMHCRRLPNKNAHLYRCTIKFLASPTTEERNIFFAL